ncbi:unnamed protein product [Phytomonas sp. Hart1]|nr:unnamed protein product [Phytomonas sp. Hart1]|eukprot:CCW72257.1 unnamed protein product [Phytomonas sp. isolate Hart1]
MVDMTKRERTESLDQDEDASTPTSRSSDSVESASDLQDPFPNGSSLRELDASEAALSVNSIDPDDDSGIERELEHLGVDDDLKASIRTMTPNTQREVINDIVRTRQVSPLMLGGMGPGEGLFERRQPSGPEDLRAGLATGMIRNAIEVYDMLGPILTRFDGANAGEGPEAPPEAPDLVWDSRQMSMLLSRMPIFQEVQQLLTMQHMGLERDIDDMSYEELLALEERIGNVSKGVRSEKEMSACMRHLPRPPTEGSCAICLDAFKEEEGESEDPAPLHGNPRQSDSALKTNDDGGGATPVGPRQCIRIKNCGHIFHLNCIKQWLRVEKRCPVCNQEVILTSPVS